VNAEGAAVSVSVEVPVHTASPSVPTGPSAPLPRTGADVGPVVAVGLVLVLLGALLLLSVRTHLERSHA
jgi:LPXTG-motif cell wall-anchored protein